MYRLQQRPTGHASAYACRTLQCTSCGSSVPAASTKLNPSISNSERGRRRHKRTTARIRSTQYTEHHVQDNLHFKSSKTAGNTRQSATAFQPVSSIACIPNRTCLARGRVRPCVYKSLQLVDVVRRDALWKRQVERDAPRHTQLLDVNECITCMTAASLRVYNDIQYESRPD
jgi:hypothetical protein